MDRQRLVPQHKQQRVQMRAAAIVLFVTHWRWLRVQGRGETA